MSRTISHKGSSSKGLKPLLAEPGKSRVVVVPTFVCGQKRAPPNINAIVFGAIRFVAQLGSMADDVEQKRNLLHDKPGQQARQANFSTEARAQGYHRKWYHFFSSCFGSTKLIESFRPLILRPFKSDTAC